MQLSFFAEPLEPRGPHGNGNGNGGAGKVKEASGAGDGYRADGDTGDAFAAELATLDIDGMTPLQALTTLADLHLRARSG